MFSESEVESLTTLPYRSAAEVAEQAIKSAILNGELAPGTLLPETTLAKRFGLSRTPIREALMSLRASGLVDLNRGQKARVRVRTNTDLMETYELRAVLEGYAAGQSARYLTSEAIHELQKSCERFDSLIEDNDPKNIVAENLFFHRKIQEFSKNSRTTPMIKLLTEMPLVYSAYSQSPEHDPRPVFSSQHRDILAALQARDTEAAERLMREHVLYARDAALQTVCNQEAENDER